MKRKSRIASSSIADRKELESRLSEYAASAAKIQKLTADMNMKISDVRDKFDDLIASEDKIARDIFTDIQLYFTEHPEEIPDGKKSAEYVSAVVGYRTSTPSVRLPRGVDEEEIATLLRGNGYNELTRDVIEIDRRKILAATDDIKEEVAKKFGIKVSQSERFFIDPKFDAIDKR